MKYTYDNSILAITAEPLDLEDLRATKYDNPTKFDSDSFMYDLFEKLITNSELEWINPVEITALTDAPILGILGSPEPGAGGRLVGRWKDSAGVMQGWYQPILHAWGYADYQVRNPQTDLLEKGKVIFVSHF